MSPVLPKQATSTPIDILGALVGGLDTRQVDDFLDQMFHLAMTWGAIACMIVEEETLRVHSDEVVVQEAVVPRAKTKLRMACARLAVRCSEWSGRPVSAYGDTVDVEHPRTKRICKVRFENTTESQVFEILQMHPPA